MYCALQHLNELMHSNLHLKRSYWYLSSSIPSNDLYRYDHKCKLKYYMYETDPSCYSRFLFSIIINFFFQQLQQILCIMDFLIEFLFTPLSTSGLVFLFSLAAVALLHLNTRPKPLQPPTDLNQQTVGIAVSVIFCQLYAI